MAINNIDEDWNATFSTSLPDGTYCDVISGANMSSTCTGKTCVISTVVDSLFFLLTLL